MPAHRASEATLFGRSLLRRAGAAPRRVSQFASRGEDAARGVVDEIRSAGGTAEHVIADVSAPDDAPRIAEAALEQFGAIDILCSNAGIFPPKSLRELTAAEIDEVFNVNLRGTMLVVKACIPAVERSGHGRVILTSSITGPITGYPGWSHYGASKAGQLGFMRTVAMEVAGAGYINARLKRDEAARTLLGPDADVITDHARRLIEQRLAQEALDKVRDQITTRSRDRCAQRAGCRNPSRSIGRRRCCAPGGRESSGPTSTASGYGR